MFLLKFMKLSASIRLTYYLREHYNNNLRSNRHLQAVQMLSSDLMQVTQQPSDRQQQ